MACRSGPTWPPVPEQSSAGLLAIDHRYSTHQLSNASVRSTPKDDDSDTKDNKIAHSSLQVVLLVPVTFLQKHKPQHRWDVVGKARDEQRGADREDIRENRYRFSDDPCKQGDGKDETKPGGPALRAVNVAGAGIGEHLAVDVAAYDSGIDGSRDEDDWKSDTKDDPRDQWTSRK